VDRLEDKDGQTTTRVVGEVRTLQGPPNKETTVPTSPTKEDIQAAKKLIENTLAEVYGVDSLAKYFAELIIQSKEYSELLVAFYKDPTGIRTSFTC
jgi:hypothetical protein